MCSIPILRYAAALWPVLAAAPERDGCKGRAKEMRLGAPVGVMNAQEHVRQRSFEAVHAKRLAREAVGACQRPARQERAGGHFRALARAERAALREDRIQVEKHLAPRRLLPQDLIGPGRRFSELEIAGPRLVRPCARDTTEEERDEGNLHVPPHGPFLPSAAGLRSFATGSIATV